MHSSVLRIETPGRGTVEISGQVAKVVAGAGIDQGLCHVFVHHTSASLIVCENADPSVRRDLEAFFAKLAPDGGSYEHSAEGPDDMPAHIRSVLTQTSMMVPVREGRLALGTWQGLYLWEHRHSAHARTVTVTVFS